MVKKKEKLNKKCSKSRFLWFGYWHYEVVDPPIHINVLPVIGIGGSMDQQLHNALATLSIIIIIYFILNYFTGFLPTE